MNKSLFTCCCFPPGAPNTLAKKVDLDIIPQVKGQSIYEYDIETADKPWKIPGKCFYILSTVCTPHIINILILVLE